MVYRMFWVIFLLPLPSLMNPEETEYACNTPVAPINGRVNIYGDNLLVEYFCDDGFFMHGDSFGSCIMSKGEWTIKTPWCLAYDCPKPRVPSHGYLHMENNNSIARFSCARRYYLMGGEDTLFCLGNRWSGYVPLCVAATVSTRGRIDRTEEVDTILNFDEALHGSDDTCSRYRVIQPPSVDNATHRSRFLFNEARRMWATVANYTCDDGFELVNKDNRYMFCQNYNWWAPVMPRCKKAVAKFYPCEKSRCEQVCIPGSRGGQYACGCYKGYTLASDGWGCKDINECLVNNGRCDHICYNRLGSRMCACRQGYLKVGNGCIDMDECEAGIDDCPGQCINTVGSYTCNCSGVSGYIPDISRPCKDLNECKMNNGGCENVCINTVSSYRCRCKKKGYYLADDKHSCADRDECVKYGKKICHNGHCVNTNGSFYCDCNVGYRFHRPSKQCIDENECKRDNGGCIDECLNTVGSFMCLCTAPGLTENGTTCVDINECDTDNGGCEDICINTHGSFYCMCEEYGYVIHENKLNCTTCKETEFIYDKKKMCIPCPTNSHTTNFTASSPMECQCNEGYLKSPVRGVFCEDIDECSTGDMLCDYGCVNTPGSAYCRCPEGYTNYNGSVCIDFDECTENTSRCEGLCLNLEGGYQCDCREGYYLANDSYSCIDINECSEDYPCSHKCINTNGGYYCSCYTGYELDLDNITCKDIDECRRFEGMKCEDECHNLEGSFECVCKNPGLKLSWDKFSCSDVNECQEGVNFCSDICVNTFGSYRCECNQTGYAIGEDTHTCRDLDECSAPNLNDCQQNCHNFDGSYNCSCYQGYIQISPTKCEECPINTYHNQDEDTCVPCPQWSETLEPGAAGLENCKCIDGYHGNLTDGEQCTDVNECLEHNFGCEQKCVNTEGAAHCSCNQGFRLDKNKKNCTDIDECKYHYHFCTDICENSPGSYACSCREGFKLYKDKRNCIDINECSEELNPCDQHCENTWGSYLCGCVTRGYVLDQDGHTCRENRPKVQCPEDVTVDLPKNALHALVEIPDNIFADSLLIVPTWVSRITPFPVGETIVTVSTRTTLSDKIGKVMCTFRVIVNQM